jgi:alkanesulfonate monooxygenase SsuD/methylene tetrahydromethanopterin reductase-like flavin-dependent oxidoreductase (luciferase family)
VACTAFHPPGLIAKMAATIDDVSGGRFVVALGSGWNEPEFRAFGIPFDHPVSRFEDAFTIIRRLLAGERVTHAGRYTHVEDAVLLPRPARRPPLMVGANGPRMLRITLPHVDVWNTWYDLYGNTAEGFAAMNDEVSAGARDVGRPPDEVERSACVFVRLDPSADERPVTPEAPPVEGTPEQIAERLRELADAGADEAILVVSPITERSIRELAEAVAAV